MVRLKGNLIRLEGNVVSLELTYHNYTYIIIRDIIMQRKYLSLFLSLGPRVVEQGVEKKNNRIMYDTYAWI